MLKQWLTWLRFFLVAKPATEVDDELQFHLEQQTKANIAAGMEPQEARRQAVLAFGAVETAREQTHEERPDFLLHRGWHDMRYALRGFRRNPVFTVTIIATLMLGIGATTAVFSVVDRILFRPLPYAHADRLVSLGLVQSLETQEFMVGAFYYDWRDRQSPFETISSEEAVAHECDLTERNPAQLSCVHVEQGFLPMLGVAPVLGRNFLPEEDRPGGPAVALLSYGLWASRYNRDRGILNRILEIDGNRVQVVGVLPRDFELPSLHHADMLFPLALDEAAQRRSSPRLGALLRGFARLKPGVSLEQARARMEPLYQSAVLIIPPQIRKDFHLNLRSLRDRQMQSVRPLAWVLLGTALAVLLIACANVASLLLARGSARTRELAVRSALGASRGRLAMQAITECLLLSFGGAIAGCALAEVLLRGFLAIAPAGIPYLGLTRMDGRIVLATILLSLVCGVLFGVAPALQRPNGEMLGARSGHAGSQATIRQLLVVAQIAASIVLLAGAALLLRSFSNLLNQQLGVRTENIITASITLGQRTYGSNQQVLAFFKQLRERLSHGPGVSLVATADSVPPAANHNQGRFSSIGVAGKPPAASQDGGSVTYRWVSPQYFRVLDIPMLQGSGFREDQLGGSSHLVVLSKTLAARLFPEGNAVGQTLQLDGAPSGGVGGVVRKSAQVIADYTVVGVAADVKNDGLAGEDLPEYYRLRRDRAEDWERGGAWGGSAVVIMRTSLPPQVMYPWIRAEAAAIDPTLPVELETMRQRVSKLAGQPRFQTLLVGFFAAMGLVLAVIGIYGVLSFLVLQQTREIGVRMALGASKGDILRLVMGKSLRLVAIGIALGLSAAFAGSRILSSQLFGVSAHDPMSFVLVTGLLLLVALAATLIPARSATRVDPIVALRYE